MTEEVVERTRNILGICEDTLVVKTTEGTKTFRCMSEKHKDENHWCGGITLADGENPPVLWQIKWPYPKDIGVWENRCDSRCRLVMGRNPLTFQCALNPSAGFHCLTGTEAVGSRAWILSWEPRES